MPELPEVETIARYLRQGKDSPPLIGQVVRSAEVLWARSVADPAPDEFSRRLAGEAIRGVGRRAKFLVIQLEHAFLLVHLRMSGDLRMEMEQDGSGQPKPLSAHDRLALHLESAWRLVLNDPRKFGRAWLVNDPQAIFKGLGPEPLEPSFTSEALYERLRGRNRQLKPLLLDQTFLAGLGNIYTDEALHLARLHPNQLSGRLTRADAGRLWAAIRSVLEEGIRRNGASIDWVYRGGDFQNTFRVYQRTGKPCPVCGTAIERRLVGQRGTHFCPICQPEPV